MRRLLWCALVLLLPAVAGAQDFIRYYPPALPSNMVATTSNLSLQSGTTAQSFYIYNTISGADYERLSIGDDSLIAGALTDGWAILPQKGGAGTDRALYLAAPAGKVIYLVNGTTRIAYLDNTGFVPYTANTYDLGQGSSWRYLFLANSIQGSNSKSLTDAAAAVSFVRIAVPTNGMIGGKLMWKAQSSDGTDQRTLTGSHYFSFADKSGTVTCGTPGLIGTANLTSTNANTLACTVTAATSTTNCDLQVTCTDNTAGTQTMSFMYRLDLPTTTFAVPQ